MKKLMKRAAFIAVLIVIMPAVMTGCQKKEENTSSKTNTVNGTKKSDAVRDDTIEKEKDQAQAQEQERAQAQEQEKVQEQEKDVPYESGTISEQGYESKWMNIKFVLPENCVMATKDEIKTLFEQGADKMPDGQKVLDNNITYEMMGYNTIDQTNINVITEKLPLKFITEEQYLKTAQKTIQQVGGGMYQISDQITDATVAGQPFKKSSMTAVTSEVKLHQDTYVRKIGDYMVVITASCTEGSEASLSTMMAAFQPYA